MNLVTRCDFPVISAFASSPWPHARLHGQWQDGWTMRAGDNFSDTPPMKSKP